MYIAPSSGHEWLNCNLPFKLILRRFGVVFLGLSENAALFERLVKIHSNAPILYYGFNFILQRKQKISLKDVDSVNAEHYEKPNTQSLIKFGYCSVIL